MDFKHRAGGLLGPKSTIRFTSIENYLPVYYHEYTCRDDLNIKLKDGSHIVFLNCCYEGNDISEELRDFFNYINTGKATGEKDNFAHRIENEVAINRQNEEWEVAYMTFEEIVQTEARKAKAEGIEQGKILTVKNLLKKFQPEEIAELLKMILHQLGKCVCIQKNNELFAGIRNSVIE